MADTSNKSGFETTGYIDKKGGQSEYNQMPPGMDITNQSGADIREMPLKKITPMGYEGDGGFSS